MGLLTMARNDDQYSQKNPSASLGLTTRLADVIMFLLVLLALVAFYRIYHRPVSVGRHARITGTPRTDQIKFYQPKIDPNTASLDQLIDLPGIGPAKARAIVELRQTLQKAKPTTQPFNRLEDLLEVHGIGPKLLVRIKPYIDLPTEPD